MAKRYRGWEGEPNFRWQAMVKGKKIRVTCDELGTARTAEGSYKAWQQYLAQKKLELATSGLAPELASELTRLERAKELAPVGEQKELDQISKLVTDIGLYGIPASNPHMVRLEERERVAGIELAANPANCTIRQAIEEYLAIKRTTVKPKSFADILLCFKLIRDDGIISNNQRIASINEDTLNNLYQWLSKRYSWSKHNSYLCIFRAFVKWCRRNKGIREPLNIDEPLHKRAREVKAIKTYSNSEVKEFINSITDWKIKLYCVYSYVYIFPFSNPSRYVI